MPRKEQRGETERLIKRSYKSTSLQGKALKYNYLNSPRWPFHSLSKVGVESTRNLWLPSLPLAFRAGATGLHQLG